MQGQAGAFGHADVIDETVVNEPMMWLVGGLAQIEAIIGWK